MSENLAHLKLATAFTTFEELKRLAKGKTAYYAVHTCWWSFTTPYTLPVPGSAVIGGLPCDPTGSVLMEADAVKFIESAEANFAHYGKHGLRAFAAAFHGNVLTINGKPTALCGWDHYNALLDRKDYFQ